MADDLIASPLRIGNHLVAGIWRYMLPSALSQMALPRETQAACMRCPKVVSDAFDPVVRCCTYHPRIPNFLLGLALLHAPGGEALLEGLLAEGMLTPEGMTAAPLKWQAYVATVAQDAYGKSPEIVCPLLDHANGHCKVYAFRNAVCSTFFCHNDHGGRGEKFWEALDGVASQCELALGQWVMSALGFDVAAYMGRLDALVPATASNPATQGWSADALAALWGPWAGRELAFFKAAGELVSEHRDKLWQIANSQEILEARQFDQQALADLPQAQRQQLEEEEPGQGEGPAESPASLWQEVIAAHRRLWALPGGVYSLAKRVVITPNPNEDAEERFYAARPAVVVMLSRQDSPRQLWREFVSAKTAAALRLFENSQNLSPAFLQSLQIVLGEEHESRQFIAEWYGKNVLHVDKSVTQYRRR